MTIRWKRRKGHAGYESAAGVIHRGKRKWNWIPAPGIDSGLKDHGFDFLYEAKVAAQAAYSDHLTRQQPHTPSAILRIVITHAERVKIVNPYLVGADQLDDVVLAALRQCGECLNYTVELKDALAAWWENQGGTAS